MAYTIFTHVSDGVSKLYPIQFELGYIEQAHVYVYTGTAAEYATQLNYTWADSNTIELDVALPEGTTFSIRRVVPRDNLSAYFATTRLRGNVLDNVHLQLLMISQEFDDGFLSLDGITIAPGDFDMQGNLIRNLAYAIADSDAVPLQQLKDYLSTVDLQGVIPLLHPRQQGDGNAVTFATPTTSKLLAESFFVQLDALTQRPYTDYTINDDGTLTFDEAPPKGVDIDITLFEPVNLNAAGQFQVTATGSTTPRTLADRFADVVNVKDFGAVGDGVTDDTVAIQNALDTSGHIIIPEGTYNVSSALKPVSNSKIYNKGVINATQIITGDECIIKVVDATNVELHGMDLNPGLFAANSGIIIRENTSEVRVYNTVVRDAAWDAARGGGRGVIVEANTGAPANIIVDGLYCENVDTVFAINGYTGSRKNNIVASNIAAANCEKLIVLFGVGAGYPHSADTQSCTITNVTGNDIRQPIRFDRAANAILSNIHVFNQNTVPTTSFIQGHCNNVVFDGTYEHQTGGSNLINVYNNTSWKDNNSSPDEGYNTEKSVFNVKFMGRADDMLDTGYTDSVRTQDCVFNFHVDQIASNNVQTTQFDNMDTCFIEVYNSEHNCRITGFADEINRTQFSAVASENYSPRRQFGNLQMSGSAAIPTDDNNYSIGSPTNRLSSIETHSASIGNASFTTNSLTPVSDNSYTIGDDASRLSDLFVFDNIDILHGSGRRYKMEITESSPGVATVTARNIP